jgi:NTF2 fold immunity protein
MVSSMTTLRLATLLLCLLTRISADADSVLAQNPVMGSIDCTLARVAERYIAAHWPSFDSFKFRPFIRDHGNIWIVEYLLPPGFVGGTPVVEIDRVR